MESGSLTECASHSIHKQMHACEENAFFSAVSEKRVTVVCRTQAFKTFLQPVQEYFRTVREERLARYVSLLEQNQECVEVAHGLGALLVQKVGLVTSKQIVCISDEQAEHETSKGGDSWCSCLPVVLPQISVLTGSFLPDNEGNCQTKMGPGAHEVSIDLSQVATSVLIMAPDTNLALSACLVSLRKQVDKMLDTITLVTTTGSLGCCKSIKDVRINILGCEQVLQGLVIGEFATIHAAIGGRGEKLLAVCDFLRST